MTVISYSVITALLAAGSLYSAPWIRIASPHFEIYTDSGERSARRVLTRFEQARRVLSSGDWHETPGIATRILLFSSAREYSSVRPGSNVSGFYQSGPDRDYIVMAEGAELDRIILHEYTHAVLNHSSVRLPQWLEEGLCEFYSTLAVGDAQAAVGSPIAAHLYVLAQQKWLTGDQLGAVDQHSPQYNEAGKNGVFYAQSWALTHMLMLGTAYRGKLPGLLEALAAGQPADDAFKAAFGKTMETAIADLPAYIQAGFRTMVIGVDRADSMMFSESTALDPAEALQSRAEILMLMGRNREAQKVYEDVAKRYPNSPAAQTGLAVIAMRDEDVTRARACFERAIALGGHDGSTYFEYAMLLRDTGADPGLVTEILNKAVTANPAHAEAHFLLGIRASDAEHYSEAVEHLRKATEILPRQAYFWQALSYAWYQLGRIPDARNAALRALRCATTDHEVEMARNALKLVERAQPPSRARRPSVITPDSWNNPKGDKTLSGDLIQVDCGESSARLHIRAVEGITILEVKDPHRVVIRGQGSEHTFTCGAQSPAPVIVDYVAATKQVTAVEFRR